MLNQKLIAVLPDLAAFILVVNEGSFTLASKQLNVTPSALSKLITRLEKALAIKLFERTTRSLTITEAGKKVYEQSVLMVNAAQQVIDISEADHTELVGSITVAAPEAYLNSVLQPYILPFLDQYPDIQLKLRAVDGDIDLNQNIDIAFRLTDQPHENQVLKEIRKTNLVLCASPDYLKKKGTPSHPTQLNDHDCLYLAETTNDHSWDFLKDDEFHTVSVSGRYAVNHSQMRLAGVKGGLGIGIFHDFVVKDALESGSVIEVLPDWTLKSNYHGAVAMQYAQTKYMPARLRVFIDYIVDKLSND